MVALQTNVFAFLLHPRTRAKTGDPKPRPPRVPPLRLRQSGAGKQGCASKKRLL